MGAANDRRQTGFRSVVVKKLVSNDPDPNNTTSFFDSLMVHSTRACMCVGSRGSTDLDEELTVLP